MLTTLKFLGVLLNLLLSKLIYILLKKNLLAATRGRRDFSPPDQGFMF